MSHNFINYYVAPRIVE